MSNRPRRVFTFRDMIDLEIKLTVYGLKVVFTFYAGLFAFLTPSIIAYGIVNSYTLDLVVGPVIPFVTYFIVKGFWFDKDQAEAEVLGPS